MAANYSPGDIIIRRYKVVREIGRGGMGVVLEVHDLRKGETVALKYCADAAHRRRFERESRIMNTIEHPNVMPILRTNHKHQPPYFVMPLAVGPITRKLANATPVEIVEALLEACEGLQAIHNSGVSHRDVKPDNILELEDGTVVVSDLGLARFHERDSTALTQTSAVVGTLAYCAPEQLVPGGSRDADARTDIFQLGKTLYELTTGEIPSVLDRSKIPKGLDHIISRATNPDPALRYQSVAALMDALTIYLHAQGRQASPQSEFEEALLHLYEEAAVLNHVGEDSTEVALSLLIELSTDDNHFIEQFYRLGEDDEYDLLLSIAELYPQYLVHPLRQYGDSLERVIRDYNFGYAERVAALLSPLFRCDTTNEIKVLALRAIMIAAAALHRFAAMEVFDKLLMSVKETSLAIEVAEMLKEHADYYRILSDRVPSARLCPPLQRIKQSLE